MSERRRIPVNRRIKASNDHHPSPRLHRKVVVRRSKPKFIRRCSSEPATWIEDQRRHMTPPGDSNCMMSRNRVFTDVFSSSPELLPNSPEYRRGSAYDKDAKIVVKVMVEGSVGPIRALVKLGSSVEETIKLVMNKYNAEGRSPRLDQHDHAVTTSFELHHSNFSLQCLDKSNMIGEIGTRSFYLRKKSTTINGDVCSNNYNYNASIDSNIGEDSMLSPSSCSSFLPAGFIFQKFKTLIIQTTSKIWRFLDCFGA